MPRKLYIVGIGPGGPEHLTPAAAAAIDDSGTVVGYKTYLDLVMPLLEGKDVRSSGMRKEVDRCREALELAAEGDTVALVSSGDAGIYGMAGLVLELAERDARGQHSEALRSIDIEIVPGVSAVQAAAARLGAPLMHDFAVISLSDLLTPWDLIRRRLMAAAAADFVIALYNPASRTRTSQLSEAVDILLRRRSPETPVGIVRNACRRDETVTVTTLASLTGHPLDMLSLVIVGNATTFVDGTGRMVTRRGYEIRSREPGARSQGKTLNPETCSLKPAFGRARALFIGGTGSDVGKSVIVAGLCRVLNRRGFSVAPFKAQNMALNSAVTPEGGEIGRAQALQAAACGLASHTDMNPVLLKPNSETGSQVVVQGRPVGNMTVGEYHAYKGKAFERVRESFARLAAAYEVVVMEGAGSIAEVNLKAHDITNLRAAMMAGAPVLLVADIDRGGVFAAIVGTLELLEPEEKKQVAGVIINRFRGDAGLLRSGIEAVEARTGVPVVGVVPWIDLRLPEEDSVALARKGRASGEAAVRIGVVRLPRISNYSDFDALEREPGVELRYLGEPEEVDGLDLVVLPGTKSTLPDMQWLREKGFFRAIHDFHAAGGYVAGICGGYQMLGRTIADPDGVESGIAEAEGLGLLDVTTELKPVKQTHQVEAVPLPAAGAIGLTGSERVGGYEIHMGNTLCGPLCRPFLRTTLRSGRRVDLEEGAVSSDGRVFGTYLHGFFDDSALRRPFLELLASRRGVPLPAGSPSAPTLEEELDRLADHLEAHLDIPFILGLLGPECGGSR